MSPRLAVWLLWGYGVFFLVVLVGGRSDRRAAADQPRHRARVDFLLVLGKDSECWRLAAGQCAGWDAALVPAVSSGCVWKQKKRRSSFRPAFFYLGCCDNDSSGYPFRPWEGRYERIACPVAPIIER